MRGLEVMVSVDLAEIRTKLVALESFVVNTENSSELVDVEGQRVDGEREGEIGEEEKSTRKIMKGERRLWHVTIRGWSEEQAFLRFRYQISPDTVLMVKGRELPACSGKRSASTGAPSNPHFPKHLQSIPSYSPTSFCIP
jgi:hypothetical protein